MFGYVSPDLSTLSEDMKLRFRAAYCGLCRTLRIRHGLTGTSTLSYDLTFLALLLSSLYESAETKGKERCVAHPFRQHAYWCTEAFEYAADMNVALAYHKCRDNWLDDRSLISAAEASLLKNSYRKIALEYPEKCFAIEKWLDEIHRIEQDELMEIDPPVNSTGKMLGELFFWKQDFWADSLRIIGDGLGRYIYFMDAYDDLQQDIRRKSYNPLKAFRDRADFELMCRDALTMMVADSTQEFETLPIVQDIDLLRNVLYSGIWSRYAQIQRKKEEANSKGAK